MALRSPSTPPTIPSGAHLHRPLLPHQKPRSHRAECCRPDLAAPSTRPYYAVNPTSARSPPMRKRATPSAPLGSASSGSPGLLRRPSTSATQPQPHHVVDGEYTSSTSTPAMRLCLSSMLGRPTSTVRQVARHGRPRPTS